MPTERSARPLTLASALRAVFLAVFVLAALALAGCGDDVDVPDSASLDKPALTIPDESVEPGSSKSSSSESTGSTGSASDTSTDAGTDTGGAGTGTGTGTGNGTGGQQDGGQGTGGQQNTGGAAPGE